MSSAESTIGAAALDYVQRHRWPVFPVKRDKTPLTVHGVKDATTDPEQVWDWWEQSPDAGVGIATGSRSGLWVLDVDGDQGADALRDLEQQHGDLPDTVRAVTGGGGAHYFFRDPAPGQHRNTSGKIAPGLDTRGEGGYIVAPPSVHPSGRVYVWDVPPDEGELAHAPGWLLQAAEGRRNGGPPQAPEPIPEGRRDSTLLSLAGSMRHVGMSGAEIEAALLVVNRDRCQPPQDEAKVRELARRAGGYPAGTPRVAAPEAAEAARELADLLALPSIGVTVAGCRIVGTGREASGDIFLSDGRWITFPRLTIAMSATSLMEQVVSTVGAEPALKNDSARHAVALMRQIGKVEEAISADTLAAQWGRDFIEAASVIDVDMTNQQERWGAFARLRDRDPVWIARAEGGTVARASEVLRDLDGNLYVRTGWFKAYIRQAEDHTISPGALATMMLRVGWHRPGREGRMKATRPGFRTPPDVQSFYIVPADWDDRSTPGASAGEGG